jgi:heme-degrading monooxygenase HmoA
MIIRIFRAQPKPGMADELAQLIEEVSIPFVDRQPGMLARYTGRGIGSTGDELVMISVWESLEAMKNMTGDDWEGAVIPDQREVDRIAESSVNHFRSVGVGKV